MLLVDTSAELTNLTSSGEPSAVLVHGGSPTLDGLVLEGVGTISFEAGHSFGRSSVAISDGSTAVIRNSIVRNGGSITASGVSTPRIEGNMLVGGPHVALLSVGDGTTVISNSIDGSLSWAIGAFSPGAVVIEGNIIINPGADGAVSL